MKTSWMRSLIRRFGNAGVVIVALILPLYILWRRRPWMFYLLIACLLMLLILFSSVGNHRKRNSSATLLDDLPSVLTSQPPNTESLRYKVIDLGAPTGAAACFAYDINRSGEVTGVAMMESKDDRPRSRGYVWRKGKMTLLGTLGGRDSWAMGISDRGQVSGMSDLGGDVPIFHAFSWNRGAMDDLGTLGGDLSVGLRANKQGWVAGASLTEDDNLLATLWVDRQPKPVGASEGRPSVAVDVNDKGTVVGVEIVSRNKASAFVWTDNRTTTIPPLGGNGNGAQALNNRGQVVGWSEYCGDARRSHAFVWKSGDGKARDLGTLGGPDSAATDINDAGQVVGVASTKAGRFRATLWERGRVRDLNDLISRSSGWELVVASAVSDSGQIAGTGYHNRKIRAFLLTPERR